jgi:hydrogenase expression/formation protein HypC
MLVTRTGDDGTGTVELDGAEYTVNLSLVSEPRVGDFVIVHAGFAIEKLDAVEADARLALFAELAAHRAADRTGGPTTERENGAALP